MSADRNIVAREGSARRSSSKHDAVLAALMLHGDEQVVTVPAKDPETAKATYLEIRKLAVSRELGIKIRYRYRDSKLHMWTR